MGSGSRQFYAQCPSSELLTAFATPGWRDGFVFSNPQFQAVPASVAYRLPQSVLFRNDYANWGDIYDAGLCLVAEARPVDEELSGSGYRDGPDFWVDWEPNGKGTPAFKAGLLRVAEMAVDPRSRKDWLAKYEAACKLAGAG